MGEQAKVTKLFAQGMREYEQKRFRASEETLQEVVTMLPSDDIIVCRLADTCFGQCQAIRAQQAVGDYDEWHAYALRLYKKALTLNPSSSYAYNGLSLFQKHSEA